MKKGEKISDKLIQKMTQEFDKDDGTIAGDEDRRPCFRQRIYYYY